MQRLLFLTAVQSASLNIIEKNIQKFRHARRSAKPVACHTFKVCAVYVPRTFCDGTQIFFYRRGSRTHQPCGFGINIPGDRVQAILVLKRKTDCNDRRLVALVCADYAQSSEYAFNFHIYQSFPLFERDSLYFSSTEITETRLFVKFFDEIS